MFKPLLVPFTVVDGNSHDVLLCNCSQLFQLVRTLQLMNDSHFGPFDVRRRPIMVEICYIFSTENDYDNL